MKTTRKSLLISTKFSIVYIFITIKNPACYDLDPYIGKYCEYTSIDEPDKPLAYAGHIERDSRGEAMVHDSGEDWVYAYTGVISEIKIYM